MGEGRRLVRLAEGEGEAACWIPSGSEKVLRTVDTDGHV